MQRTVCGRNNYGRSSDEKMKWQIDKSSSIKRVESGWLGVLTNLTWTSSPKLLCPNQTETTNQTTEAKVHGSNSYLTKLPGLYCVMESKHILFVRDNSLVWSTPVVQKGMFKLDFMSFFLQLDGKRQSMTVLWSFNWTRNLMSMKLGYGSCNEIPSRRRWTFAFEGLKITTVKNNGQKHRVTWEHTSYFDQLLTLPIKYLFLDVFGQHGTNPLEERF